MSYKQSQERLQELREFVLDLTIRDQVYLFNLLIGKGNVQIPVGMDDYIDYQTAVSAEINGITIDILTEEFINKLYEKTKDIEVDAED
jgi:hypothetical protein